ncbi:hypothetical protein KAR91_75985 [Candidatus Pacearchaeota archaeon]|nr:hypothetical protein [Candidatus Pacearchaeota archaeon]
MTKLNRTLLKCVLFFVGGHLLYGGLLLVIDSVHRVNDQDFSFVVWLLFYYVNYLGVLLLGFIGAEFTFGALVLAGLPQWICLSVIVAIVIRVSRGVRGKLNSGA